jgi:hypothetical protein
VRASLFCASSKYPSIAIIGAPPFVFTSYPNCLLFAWSFSLLLGYPDRVFTSSFLGSILSILT